MTWPVERTRTRSYCLRECLSWRAGCCCLCRARLRNAPESRDGAFRAGRACARLPLRAAGAAAAAAARRGAACVLRARRCAAARPRGLAQRAAAWRRRSQVSAPTPRGANTLRWRSTLWQARRSTVAAAPPCPRSLRLTLYPTLLARSQQGQCRTEDAGRRARRQRAGCVRRCHSADVAQRLTQLLPAQAAAAAPPRAAAAAATATTTARSRWASCAPSLARSPRRTWKPLA